MRVLFTLLSIIGIYCTANAIVIDSTSYISTNVGKGYFTLSDSNGSTTLLTSSSDYAGVIRAIEDLQKDIFKVTGRRPELKIDTIPASSKVIIAGTLGKSILIDTLVKKQTIDTTGLTGKWEKFILQTVKDPIPGIESAVIIIGSDKRGTIYGIYDISEQIGVSPWSWWADVPVQKKDNIYIIPGTYTKGEPAVKYRGIFINDESPAFRNWAKEKFGGQNHKCYEKVFELLLRNKANYLWPAMWLPTIFNEDDPLNPKVADEYGIVMSTSHHEPMMRSHNEWYRFNGGEWNYVTNKDKLLEFWRGGIERMGNYESVVTVGMRGDGDEAMSEETAVDLLKNIIFEQRKIIADVTGKPAHETPQVWAVYKEVQDYYDKGMKVDDDIIILFCDDNWGNLRILPKKEDLDHKAGYGIYYHFDYVGAPVSYRWLNTTQIERVWEQMNLAYKWGVKDLWLVNVGDIKPMELPISFFLDYAWNPDAIQANDLPNYYVSWAKQQFGDNHTAEVAELLSLYTKYNARRTPEMLRPDTYSLKNYREADKVVDEFKQLLETSRNIYDQLPESHKSAFYQLVHSPIEMCCNLNEMYVAAAKNKLYGEQGRASANYYAEKVKELFFKDAELTRQFHEDLEDGKWNHMMSQTHIGYTTWNHPRANKMPAVSYIHTDTSALLGYMVEYGASPAWGGFSVEGQGRFSPSFIDFDPINQQSCYLEIFNRGDKTLDYSVKAKNDWIQLSKNKGSIQYDEKVYVSIDWEKAPKGKSTGEIAITGAGKEYIVEVPVRNDLPKTSGFIENNGVVSFDAANYTNKIDSKEIHWTVVPNLGRTHSSLIIEPVTANSQTPGDKSPRVEYEFTVFNAGDLTVETFLSPTQDFKKQGGLKFAIAIDDEEPQIINMNEGEVKPDWEYADWWMQSVGDHIKIRKSKHKVDKPGKHTLKIWMIDPGIVFQKFVIDAGGKRRSYLGAPESLFSQSKIWVGSWSCAPYAAGPGNTPPSPYIANNTLRQVVRVSIGGDTLRVKFSNKTCSTPVTMNSVYIAVSKGGSTIDTSTNTRLKFGGDTSVTMDALSSITSDPVAFPLTPSMRVAITIYYGQASSMIDMTSHVASRTDSYILPGDQSLSADFSGAVITAHWYHINTIDVQAPDIAGCVGVLGNSITDGYGLSGGLQNRWTDFFSQMLLNDSNTQHVGVLNLGIGATNVAGSGATTGVSRFQQDILSQSGLRWVIIFYGTNDIAGGASVTTITNAYQKMINDAHAMNIKVYGATITPFKGSGYYSEAHEAIRNEVNEWIRTPGNFDACIDFDKTIRDPNDTSRLMAEYSNDWLHPNVAGYQFLGESINVNWFTEITDNSLPIANAGANQTLIDYGNNGNRSVKLNGSVSSDFGSTITSYIWSEGGSQIATGENPSVILTAGTHTITLKVTDNDGNTDTDEVTITVAKDSGVWLEAECGTVGSLWNVETDDNASNSNFVTIKPDNNSTDAAPLDAPSHLTYTFNVSESGSYTLYTRVICHSSNDDSFWLKMDDGSFAMWNNIAHSYSWTWTNYTSAYHLSKGNHMLTIGYREDGAKLDKLWITRNNADLYDEGSVAGNCSVSAVDF